MFTDRVDAAEQLVVLLREHGVVPDVVVAVPRGGVPIGNRVAEAFGVPLVVLSVKKVSAPSSSEFALGAVTDGGVVYLDTDAVEMLGIDGETVDLACEEALNAAKERARSLDLSLDTAAERIRGRSVLVVDDGLATGSTVRACCRQVRELGASNHTVAVPVAAPDSVTDLQEEGCAVVAVETPPHFAAVSQFYESFPQVDDETVRAILDEAELRIEATT